GPSARAGGVPRRRRAERRVGLPPGAGGGGRELFLHEAGAVVLPENRRPKLHRWPAPPLPPGATGAAVAVPASTACTLSPAVFARSNKRLGHTPRSNRPTTTVATAARAHRSRQTSTCAASVGSGFMYIAMMTGR